MFEGEIICTVLIVIDKTVNNVCFICCKLLFYMLFLLFINKLFSILYHTLHILMHYICFYFKIRKMLNFFCVPVGVSITYYGNTCPWLTLYFTFFTVRLTEALTV